MSENSEQDRLWRWVFAVSAGIFTASLIYLVALAPFGGKAAVAYGVCALAVLGCFHAARKLRDQDRAASAADGARLAQAHTPAETGDMDD